MVETGESTKSLRPGARVGDMPVLSPLGIDATSDARHTPEAGALTLRYACASPGYARSLLLGRVNHSASPTSAMPIPR